MMEQAPPSTTLSLENEATLVTNDFREHRSARIQSRKSSGARSIKGGTGNISQQTATLRYNTEISNLNVISFQTKTDSELGLISPKSAKSIEQSEPQELKDNTFTTVEDTVKENNEKELISTSSHIELNGDMKFMLDNAYANYHSEGGLSVRTPPRNLQIKDLMIPLDDWGSKEHGMIREKKYTVLPSIHSTPTPDGQGSVFNTARDSVSTTVSINNQLDFFRDKIEQEADFFADFRVNTSKVKVTPRQDPLPPIKHGTPDRLSNSSRKSRHSSKTKPRNKPVLY